MCRNEAKGPLKVVPTPSTMLQRQALTVNIDIKEVTNFDSVELFIVDLASYASVNAFCEKVEREVPRLDILVENAALALVEFIPTPDGWEHQYVLESGYNRGHWLIPPSRVQVNHLATALLSILLLPLLLRTTSKDTTPRLVFVSSAARYWSPPLKPPTSDQGILDWLNDRSKSEG